MSLIFRIPFYTAEMLEEKTEASYRAAFQAFQALPKAPLFIEMRGWLSDTTGGHCVPEKHVLFFPYLLEDTLPDSLLDPIRAAWVKDGLFDQCILAHPMDFECAGGHYVSLFWNPDVAVLCQEYLPGFLDDEEKSQAFLQGDHRKRTTLASVILPPCESNHEKILQADNHDHIQDLVQTLWREITMGCGPIALDMSDIIKPREIP